MRVYTIPFLTDKLNINKENKKVISGKAKKFNTELPKKLITNMTSIIETKWNKNLSPLIRFSNIELKKT